MYYHNQMTIINKLINIFKEPAEAPRIQDQAEVKKKYAYWRRRMLYGSLIGYGLFYFTRKNISVAMPLLSKELGLSNTDLGILGTLLYISYGVFKLLFGFVGDRVNPRRFMAVGLALSALMNLFFPFSTSLIAFGVFWFLNGIFQASGAPPCAKICVRWFSLSERGTKWGIWNISHQAGGGLVLIIAGWFAAWWGWQAVFIGPAIICGLGVLFIANRLRDRPQELGLPPIEEYRNDPESSPDDETILKENHFPFYKLVIRRVLLNPYLLLLALSSMCLYVVRYGSLDWATKYLSEVKGHDIGWASTYSSLLEFVGIPGMLLAGWLSDKVFSARRAPICIISLLLLAGSIGLLYMVPPGYVWLDCAALAAIGFFTYGPQMLIAGVAPADACGAKVAAAAVGVTGLFSYLGAAMSSLGTGVMVDHFGWIGGFSLWIGFAILGAIFIVPLWNSRGRRR
jgi:phosphoglycerate transporter family protein